MTDFWTDYKLEAILCITIIGVVLLVALIWYFFSQSIDNNQPADFTLYPLHHLAIVDADLAPLPRAFAPPPLYERHEYDVQVTPDTELEKHSDGYYYPKNAREYSHGIGKSA